MNKKDKEIIENIKLKISISNFQKEEKMNKKIKKKKLTKILSAAACLILITGAVFAKDIQNYIQNLFGKNTSQGVDTAVNNGYVENIESKTQNADGITIEVDSLIMDDFNLAINFNVFLDEKYNIDEFEHTEFENLKIVDETGKIVFNTKNVYEEQSYMGSYSFMTQKSSEKSFKISLSATGNPEAFPKSKHLTISFTKIKTSRYINEEVANNIYEGKWNFEIDVPEEFYNRETDIYNAVSCNESGIELNQITALLSNTAFKISIPVIKTNKVDYELLKTNTPKSIYDKIALQKEYIETDNGSKFETAQRSDGDGGYGIAEGKEEIIDYHQTFNLTKYDTTDKLKVHIFTNKGEEIIINLEKSK